MWQRSISRVQRRLIGLFYFCRKSKLGRVQNQLQSQSEREVRSRLSMSTHLSLLVHLCCSHLTPFYSVHKPSFLFWASSSAPLDHMWTWLCGVKLDLSNNHQVRMWTAHGLPQVLTRCFTCHHRLSLSSFSWISVSSSSSLLHSLFFLVVDQFIFLFANKHNRN